LKNKTWHSLLDNIYKPGRYLGKEINSLRKDFKKAKIKFALAFPDLYEIGMSHLGLQILYYLLNKEDDVLAERVYMPDLDFIKRLKETDTLLFSLESREPLHKFDLVGFSLQYELSYTNVLAMLELSKIPVYAKDRINNEPLIIAGGPCVSNPEPMADFFDLFCIGEGEELIIELAKAYRENRALEKKALLWKLAQIEGIYVPSLYKTVKNKKEVYVIPKDKDTPPKIKKCLVKDLNNVPYPTSQLIPLIETVHNRAVLEIERGCTGGCRFCHSGMIGRPRRRKSIETIVRLAQKIIEETGYREISLLSLNVVDFQGAINLLEILVNIFKERKIAISFPSLRVSKQVLELAKISSIIKKSGITIAPEAGTDRLRKIINKRITTEEIINLVHGIFEMGYNLIKLYFMIGLPLENDEDIMGIVKLVRALRKGKSKRKVIKVSISSFIPKPHTPFQWESQDKIYEIKRKQRLLIENMREKGIELSWHSAEQSTLEAALARGDRRIATVIKKAYEAGCIFDSWSDRFNFKIWEDSFKEEGLDLSNYASRKINIRSRLPWDHLDMKVNKKFLIKEYLRAKQEKETSDCYKGQCLSCEAC